MARPAVIRLTAGRLCTGRKKPLKVIPLGGGGGGGVTTTGVTVMVTVLIAWV